MEVMIDHHYNYSYLKPVTNDSFLDGAPVRWGCVAMQCRFMAAELTPNCAKSSSAAAKRQQLASMCWYLCFAEIR